MNQRKVIIVGAGIGGLVLAHSLHQKRISFEIYDRFPAHLTNSDGWAITLHSALAHLRNLLPGAQAALERISVCAGSGHSDQFAFYQGSPGKILSCGTTDTLDFVRANRHRLLEWLGHGVNINWGCTYLRHEIDNDTGRVTVIFTNGTSTQGHVLVGCDGLDSRVRNMLYYPIPAPLSTLPTRCIGGSVILDPAQYARQSTLSRSLYITYAQDCRLLVGLNTYAQGMAFAEYHWLLCFPADADSEIWERGATSERQLAFARNAVQGMEYDLCEVIYLTKPEKMFTPFLVRDRVPEILPDGAGPVTLIGDAAHPMSFFKGDGGNAAVEDAVRLAEYLHLVGASSSSCERALRLFEEEMVARVAPMVLQARQATSINVQAA
ncbi:FAD/NAD(P)-binding domain-containing protein [Athelia psychrophila]|uniref:FAD/NAD(P)-binding domain-containing protein n=1 Tax=Athelia psychrophila TaxID=1759441 RepID=A0A166RQR8_9AGAM|nr:FAD/NAD(P)-binding domain-containing protein [Fibularhizoctonia sp. CBS 109695]